MLFNKSISETFSTEICPNLGGGIWPKCCKCCRGASVKVPPCHDTSEPLNKEVVDIKCGRAFDVLSKTIRSFPFVREFVSLPSSEASPVIIPNGDFCPQTSESIRCWGKRYLLAPWFLLDLLIELLTEHRWSWAWIWRSLAECRVWYALRHVRSFLYDVSASGSCGACHCLCRRILAKKADITLGNQAAASCVWLCDCLLLCHLSGGYTVCLPFDCNSTALRPSDDLRHDCRPACLCRGFCTEA